MDDATWTKSTAPEQMLAELGDTADKRKLRHFLVACAWRVLPNEPDSGMINALEIAEQFADGIGSKYDLARARAALKQDHPMRAKKWSLLYSSHIRSVPAWHATREQVVRAAREGAGCCAWSSTRVNAPGGVGVMMTYPDSELSAQAHLLRDIFGNPFRPVTFAPEWRNSSAVGLAESMYAAREFSPMPILADALEEAGCDDADILAHCRGDGPHVRGCWVVDLVLGKA